jgi:hypothetical protein
MLKKICAVSGEPFEIADEDLTFYNKIAPVFNGRKYRIPPPTLSPLMRLRRRLTFRNPISVFLRPASDTGENIFSMFPPDTVFPVLNSDSWWSDSWSALDFGVGFDPSRSFFEQFQSLRDRVPHLATCIVQNENSNYCNNCSHLKNCYLVFNTSQAQDCFYSENVWDSVNCIDCTHTKKSELCYDCIMCQRCYNVQGSQECEDCSDSYFLLNCRACSNCLGCVNLRHKEFCVYNKQLTERKYKKFIGQQKLGSYQARQKLTLEAVKFWKQHPHPHRVSNRVENISGNHLVECKNVFNSFWIKQGEDLKYCFTCDDNIKDCYDYSIPGINAERLYECCVCGLNVYNLGFSYWCNEGCSNLYYCYMCFGCEDCFGCVGLHKKQYCILNQQFTEEQYEKEVSRIIEQMDAANQWGEFFPEALAPFPYNYSYAARFFPESREEVLSQGLSWLEKEFVESTETLESEDIPDGLPESDQSMVVKSTKSGRSFRITQQEIEKYRQLNVPLPRMSYDERMEARAAELGGLELCTRFCEKTGKELLSAYPPDLDYIIWDKELWDQEFSG